MIQLWVRIQAKPRIISIIQWYASNLQAMKKSDSIPSKDIKIIMGDFDAKVGESNSFSSLVGKYGFGEWNARGDTEFCNLVMVWL